MDLLQGDCLELMWEIPSGGVNLLLTDPPYGINYQSARCVDKTRRKPKILNDKTPFLGFIPEVKRILNPAGCAMIFTRWDVQQAYIDELAKYGLHIRNILIWDKMAHGMGDLKRSYGSRYESILFASNNDFRFPGNRPQDILSCPKVPSNKLVHPNEKPVPLLETLICRTTNPGDVVLDVCMGSGSTGVACVNTGRDFIGMELDEHYFRIAKTRIEEAMKGDRNGKERYGNDYV